MAAYGHVCKPSYCTLFSMLDCFFSPLLPVAAFQKPQSSSRLVSRDPSDQWRLLAEACIWDSNGRRNLLVYTTPPPLSCGSILRTTTSPLYLESNIAFPPVFLKSMISVILKKHLSFFLRAQIQCERLERDVKPPKTVIKCQGLLSDL